MTRARTHAWIDASAGVAGDMLLGALLDAGADLDAVRAAVHAVVGDAVSVRTERVRRAGLAATKAHVDLHEEDPPHRTWTTVRALLGAADLPDPVRRDALAVFAALATAEGAVHGVPADDVHFHEVGALDSVADVVGVCAALHDLGVTSASAGAVALGSGTVRAAHGAIPVPVPAVVALSRGRRVRAGGEGELTTPTGMALLAALATTDEDLPELTVAAWGSGAGTRDVPGRPNVTRVVLGEPAGAGRSRACQLEATVDDLDPRLWPGVLARVLAAGAFDAWLVPVLGKKGRPAHVLTVLSPPGRAGELEELVVASTSTLGVRRTECTRLTLERDWVDVRVEGTAVPVKVGLLHGVVQQVMPEFEDVARLAAELGRPERRVLAAAHAAAAAAGWVVGQAPPAGPRRGEAQGR
ncbi:nickel pincer cofactor biosynthesis protein LarC [Kineococcus sp. LSe6-4]|uniref:Pyridinium-3,5-bisthiocarboxylic acid mononucleotide nickel insertion protein n=1 Tax=Kineococcus halophytocola TaxID=3234027 RepID=A0ABV4H1F7_9ACTN